MFFERMTAWEFFEVLDEIYQGLVERRDSSSPSRLSISGITKIADGVNSVLPNLTMSQLKSYSTVLDGLREFANHDEFDILGGVYHALRDEYETWI